MTRTTGILGLLRLVWRFRTILLSTTWLELRKRYAGTLLGPVWLVLYPTLFLLMYVFLYMVVFRIRFPELGSFGFVVLVFCGLVPYLAVMDAASAAVGLIKQNIFLIKNVMVPIDLLPMRVVLVAMAAQAPGLIIVLVLAAMNGDLSMKALALPAAIVLEAVFLLGVVLVLSVLGGLVPDFQSAMNIILIFLLFVSPISFPSSMVPESAQLALALNPITYLVQVYRSTLLEAEPFHAGNFIVLGVIGCVLCIVGSFLFSRYKAQIVDNE